MVNICRSVPWFLSFLLAACFSTPCLAEGVAGTNAPTRVVRDHGRIVTLDLSGQILSLDIPEEPGPAKEEAEVFPSLKSLRGRPQFVGVSVLAAKAKQFDDGLYAAVEILCQHGASTFMGKRDLLECLSKALREMKRPRGASRNDVLYCRAVIHAAARAGGWDIDETRKLEEQSARIREVFLARPLLSKPIAFYTWSDELSNIFRQDRLLQSVQLQKGVVRAMASGVSNDKEVLDAYHDYLALIKELTNPFPPEFCDVTETDMLGLEGARFQFFPPSRAHETALIMRLFRKRSIPEGFSLIDELIRRIQSGEIKLKPAEDSGWYDYQVYALEPFVLPERVSEAEKLRFSDNYKKELIRLFKGILALTRETHIKQLWIPSAGMAVEPEEPPIEIHPNLSVEPIPTYYLRWASAYRFVRELLEKTFGVESLGTARRLTASGEVNKPLLDELKDMEGLFYGAYLIACEEIGLPVVPRPELGSGRGVAADKELARKWIASHRDDPDVGADNRMMVPVYYDIRRGKTMVWVAMGYAVKWLSISYQRVPKATITDEAGRPAKAKLDFTGEGHPLAYPVSAELYVDRILDRDEFRALCDRCKTRSAILKALQELK